MTRAVLSALCSFAVAAIAMSAPVLAADDVVYDYPNVAAYAEYCRMADYRERYPTFCSGFFRAYPCGVDYACDEHSYPLSYDSYREYTYQAPFPDPYRGGTACEVRPRFGACYARGRY